MIEKPIEQIVCAPFHVCMLENRREETEKVSEETEETSFSFRRN